MTTTNRRQTMRLSGHHRRRSPAARGWLAALIAAAITAPVALGLAQTTDGRRAALLDVKGAIGVATGDYIRRGLEQAQAENAELVILRLDTPGGLSSSMREIIKALLAADLPIVTYVAPSGARAASAGTYIMYASHVAAMSPGTNLGAATPVRVGGPPGMPGQPERPKDEGKDEDDDQGDKAPPSGDAMERKVINDAVAYIRSLAYMRGRNADWAEKAVREAVSLPADDALKEGVIELVADDLDDLMAQLDGRRVKIGGEERVLETAGLDLVEFAPDWRSQFLSVITNPNVAYILMLVGIYGIIFEFWNPGFLLPGVLGGISLLLALGAFSVLPINFAGLALLLLGLGLLVAEAFTPSFGTLGIGGLVAFVLGSIFLFDTEVPELSISWPLVAVASATTGAFLLFVVGAAFKARDRPVVSGRADMIGDRAQVVEWTGEGGRVRFRGELWNARAAATLSPGRRVRVSGVDGLTLIVEPAAEGGEEHV
ncbi:MAG: nodulation protein NfeD [Kiloniellales bacterium]